MPVLLIKKDIKPQKGWELGQSKQSRDGNDFMVNVYASGASDDTNIRDIKIVGGDTSVFNYANVNDEALFFLSML